MKNVIWIMVVVLLILRQDNWMWENDTLVFGFMPIGLLSQAGISIGAAIVWYLATVFAWPTELEHVEESTTDGEAA
jgi:hypothetical protein